MEHKLFFKFVSFLVNDKLRPLHAVKLFEIVFFDKLREKVHVYKPGPCKLFHGRVNISRYCKVYKKLVFIITEHIRRNSVVGA